MTDVAVETAPREGTLVGAEAKEWARRLTLRYTVAATGILMASGLMGVLIHDSQASAELGRLDDNSWYALMTAHGLGAFVGWGAFAVMGFAWWVFASVGFPLRRFGIAMAELTFWTMLLGVVGVLVTTLAMNYAGSWVFLYPISFHSAGQWSDWAAGLFSASALVVGVSILTWCAGVLHTAVGPGLRARKASALNRLGAALGFGYLAPGRFATERPVPYPVIPLAVIAAGMIVATTPLAVLLVENIVQSIDPDVTVDALLAKNILWWFGHPVVYLLLFPAAACYYLLVPRYAGRPLVAGNVIAIAWAIALVANVVVWAHHVYLDYPVDTSQGAINIAMQPLTFALTLPSALSIYSLSFTIFRSNFTWTAASTALFLGIVGWLTAGLSGLINATIAFDAIVHNTLWIVGHFHHMALLNIGLLIFGATYHFLPELTGKKLWSEGMAKVHVWTTFVAGMGFFAIWLVEGLEGAPRRFSVLPSQYDTYNQVAVPFTFVLALAQILFALNVVQTLRGAGERAAGRRRRRSPATREAVFVLTTITLAIAGVALGITLWLTGGAEKAPSEAPPTAALPANLDAGREVFASAGCGSCHALASAGSSGQVGPNLDQAAPTKEQVTAVVTSGRGGMPAFGDRLTEQQIDDVGAFVAGTTGE